jgi:hypothetical protein
MQGNETAVLVPHEETSEKLITSGCWASLGGAMVISGVWKQAEGVAYPVG